uniref:Uncharacterized protein n=1 Tax=Cacopsylla melanoneura TaxID=428564 RepID=A0A8D9BAQ2_9HEMI
MFNPILRPILSPQSTFTLGFAEAVLNNKPLLWFYQLCLILYRFSFKPVVVNQNWSDGECFLILGTYLPTYYKQCSFVLPVSFGYSLTLYSIHCTLHTHIYLQANIGFLLLLNY